MPKSSENSAYREEDIAAILLDAMTAGDAIHRIYLHKKNISKNISLEGLCRQAGMPSKGYLSDVMHGKRRLNRTYRSKLAKVLGLQGTLAKYFKILLDLDLERRPEIRKTLLRELQTAKKTWQMGNSKIAPILSNMSEALEVFCAFGLFGGTPSFEQLRKYFGSSRDVRSSLSELAAAGYIEKDGDLYKMNVANLRFEGADVQKQQMDFLTQALQNAIEAVPRWFAKKEESLFDATIISTTKEKYLRAVSNVRQDLLQLQTNLECTDSDLLIRLSIQMYPV